MTATPKPMPPSERILVPVAEAAAMLSIGRATLWRGAKDGTLPKPIKIGGATRWRVADLQRFFCAASATQRPKREPLTDAQVHEWWASENGLEDHNLSKIDDFTDVVRSVEAKLGITKGSAA